MSMELMVHTETPQMQCSRSDHGIQKMWPLLLLLSVSMTIASPHDHLKEDYCNGQGEGDNLPEASMQFAITLYKVVSAMPVRPPLNVLISPISTYTTLAMLALGARSSTRQQILRAMCLSDSQANKILKEDYKNFLAELTTEEGNAEFGISNWFFLEKSIKPSSKYKQDMARYYNVSLQGIDFTDPENAQQEINEEVNGQTDGKMEDLINDLDDQTKMVLLDYARFNAKWNSPFTSQGLRRAPFIVNQMNTINVEMMHRVGQYRTFKDDTTIMVEVPYTDQIVLLIIVPKNVSLYEVERKLSAQLIDSYMSEARTSLLDLYIPKISLEEQINVHYGLLRMGVTDVFSDSADLTGISKHPRLKASILYHKTQVKIAENATESSGAEVTRGVTLPKALELRIDRPFFALVYNKQVKTVLLLGRIMDPTQV
ncbi:serine protease inhibitor A6-like [Hyla sarda]|uniref:serine protease inhibitor A6-like n=1 Tax=Hyla sarda TaxID=327740 RepID=UPI0024C2413C|nr:serine protease inhibitor A6-like [Hyla sarda]